MARGYAAAKQHAPGHVGDSTPEFAVDEIAQAPGGDARRDQRREEIHELQPGNAVLVREPEHRGEHAEEAAVEGHTALPDRENFQRMRKVERRLVEKHVAKAPA